MTAVLICCSVRSWLSLRCGCWRQWPSKAKVARSCQVVNTGTVVQDLCDWDTTLLQRAFGTLACLGWLCLSPMASYWAKEVVNVQVGSPCVKSVWLPFSFGPPAAWPSHVCTSSFRVRAEPTQPCSYNLGRRAGPPMAELSPPRATSSPCGPKELQARSRPTTDPPKMHSSQHRAHPNRSTNDQNSVFPFPGLIAGSSPATMLLPRGRPHA